MYEARVQLSFSLDPIPSSDAVSLGSKYYLGTGLVVRINKKGKSR